MVAMLAPKLCQQGMDVEVAFLLGPGPVSARLSRDRVVTHELGTHSTAMAVLKLVALLKSRQFHVINVYGIKASLLVRVVGRLVRQPAAIVCGVQGLHVTETERLDSWKARFALFLERLFSPLVDLYESNSLGALEVLREVGVRPAKLHYIPNGVDLDRWPMRSCPPAAATPSVLCTARFVPRKRQEDIIHAVAILRDRDIGVRVIFAGDGRTLPGIEKLVAERELGSSVEFLGNVDPPTLSAHFDEVTAFCLVSTWEGMPAAVMESMARGVPVVGSNVNGISDLIEDEKTGLLVPKSDPPAIADALERLIRDPDLCRRLAVAARGHIEEQHTLDIMVAKKRSLYCRVATARLA